MANFTPAYNLVAAAEGGYQKFTEDPGNFNSLGQLVGTNWGINAKVYEAHIGRPPSESDMRLMLKTTAKAIYKAKYWDRIQGDSIHNQGVANVLFDGHVNHGGWGVQMMQEVIGVDTDAKVGPITLNALNTGNPNTIINRYIERREKAYRYIAANRAGMSKFLNGWLNRLQKFVTDQPGGTNGAVGVLLIAAAAAWWASRN
jgi:lysozyme family protein